MKTNVAKDDNERAQDATAEPSKAALQRQMEETRESISETVEEIKDTVTHQYDVVKDTYETVKDGIAEAVDWKEQFKENPLVWGAGALSVGVLIGVGLARGFGDDDSSPPGRRNQSELELFGRQMLGQLTRVGDATLPLLSGKIKEMFGIDIAGYLQPAPAQPPKRKRATRASNKIANARPKKAATKTPSRKTATKKTVASKRVSGKKSGSR